MHPLPSPDEAFPHNAAPVPILVAETGHRDLVAAEVDELRRRVRAFFDEIARRWPDAPLMLMTSLAEGAGRLVAREALALRIPLIVVLPMPASLYSSDFETDSSKSEFDELCAQAEVYELPLLPGARIEDVALPGNARDQQYAQLGVFLSSHCHVLLALWDGKPMKALGGTSQVVAYHLTEQMPGYVDATVSQHIIADDENDLVYHVVCSRSRADGAPRADLRALDARWLTSDLEHPSHMVLPPEYAAVLNRSQEFNRDFSAHRNEILAAHTWPLLEKPTEQPSVVARRIETLFRIADWLAVHYQRQVHRTQRLTYLIAVLMGLVFLMYSDLTHARIWLAGFLVLFAIGFALFMLAERRDWHRKYLDYRALAEGLRVQFYWEIAGVRRADETSFAHAGFLQRQDVELGWIRNVMRWAQLRRERASGAQSAGAVNDVVAAWIGAAGKGGQLAYYARKAKERQELHGRAKRLAQTALYTGISIAVLVAIIHDMISETTRNVLFVFMGFLPLIAAVHEAYSHKRADKELIKQYRFMHRLFANARHRIERADDVRECQQVLRTLGDACLTEHAEWIRMHRDRPLEHGKLSG